MEEKKKKSIFKRWWFWLIIVIIVIGLVSGSSNNTTETNTYTKNTAIEVTIVDFSTMSKDEAQVWFDNNKINGKISTSYSDTIPNGSLINQSISANTTAHEGDKMTVTYSLGKEPTIEQKNALRKAESYSSMMHMSKQGIYNQLTSSIEGFTKDDAQYAIDNINADWNKNALEKAKSYQQTMSMSKQGIYNQLVSSIEGFTAEQAQYAIDNLDN